MTRQPYEMDHKHDGAIASLSSTPSSATQAPFQPANQFVNSLRPRFARLTG